MPSSSRSYVRTLVGFLLAGIFLYLAFRDVPLEELWVTLLQVKVGWLGVFLLIAGVSHLVRAWRWKYLLSHLKANVSVHRLFSAVMIGYMMNNLLPRAGEIARAYVVGKLEGISKSSALGTIVVERILDLVSFFFILCAVLFLYPSGLDALFADVARFRPLFLGGSVLSIVFLVYLFLKSESLIGVLKRLRGVLPHRIKDRYEHLLDAFAAGFRVVGTRRNVGMIILTSIGIWICYVLTFYVSFFAFETIASSDVGLGGAVVLLTFSTAAFILPAPGGFGTYHSFLTYALVQLYRVDAPTALSYSVATHEMGFVLIVIVGVTYFLKDHLKISEFRGDLKEPG
ncbi:MAG: flippase-like domain-containing protein [Ignavibacteria bacterium]|nr:flippase-like domain-containing protein [Ignavibacteria bacterium]